MTALVFVTLMAFSVVLAFMAKRGVIADSMDDVMVAGRSFGAFMVFFVTVGETYGIGTMIGVPGAIYSKGVSYSLWFLGYILLGFVVGYFMNPAIWRMGKISGAMTMPDCFRWRYGSKALEVLVAVICIVFLLPWMQMQFAGLATILRYIGWDISYTVGIGILRGDRLPLYRSGGHPRPGMDQHHEGYPHDGGHRFRRARRHPQHAGRDLGHLRYGHRPFPG